MKQLFYLFCLLFSIVYFTACEDVKEDVKLDSFGYEYFPLEMDAFWIYKVDSVIYTKLGDEKDTTSSYVKEEIIEVFVDQLQDTVYRIERSVSQSSTYDFKVVDIWAAQKDRNKATRTEENLKYMKLVFPLKEAVSWNGNSFITEDVNIFVGGETLDFFIDWDYKVLSIESDVVVGDNTYSQVATIQNADSGQDELIHRRYVIEKYAKGVGLVYKKHIILDTQCIVGCEDQTWEEKGEKGYVLESTLVEYGK